MVCIFMPNTFNPFADSSQLANALEADWPIKDNAFMNKPTIGERLRAAMGDIGENELSRRSQVPQSTIHRILNGQSKEPRRSNVIRIAMALDRSPEWLLSGDGPEFPGNPAASGLAGLGDPAPAGGVRPPAADGLGAIHTWDDRTPLDDDEVEVPLFKEVELAAGSGAAHSVEINGRKLRFSKATMRAAGVSEANAACATVSGNSMERLIMDGSTVGIDRARTQIRDGEIYAIDHDGMLRVKYLYRLPGGGLRIRSENSEEHPDELLTAEQAKTVRVLGWVFWWSTVRRWR